MEQKKQDSKMQLNQAYINKRSQQYEKTGFHYAEKIDNRYLKERILAFLVDTSVAFSPILLWIVIMMLIFGNLISVVLITAVQILCIVLMIISMLFFNPLISSRTHGQTLGKLAFDLKVVRKNRHEASSGKLICRELFGFSIPYLLIIAIVTLLGLPPYLNLIGIMAYWLLDFIVLLIHPRHLSIIDMFLGTRIVVLHEPEEISEQKQPAQTKANTTIDLHLHSNFSGDGEYNVEEIFQMAKARGMETISITDHNSAKANLIAEKMSKLYHVNYVPGIEIDCTYEGKNMHVLGYFIKYNSELYAHIENDILAKEKKASLERVKLFEDYSGMKVDVDALLDKNRFQTISGEQIAEQVLANPVFDGHPMLEPYRSGGARSDMPYVNFYWDYFSQGKPCYVDVKYPKFEDIIEVIKLTDGVPVIAHPYQTFRDDISFIEKLIDKGIEGIEVFSSYHSTKEMAELLKIAKEKKVFITAGSDFHGKNKPTIQVGDTKCPPEAEKLIQQLIQYH